MFIFNFIGNVLKNQNTSKYFEDIGNTNMVLGIM